MKKFSLRATQQHNITRFSSSDQFFHSNRKFIYLKRGECPICQGQRNDCRSSGDLIHCRSNASTPIDWQFLGTDRQGFGLYLEGNGDRTPTAEERDRWRNERDSREKARAEKLARSLSPEERDRQYRIIARHSGLSRNHRADLEKRGYLPEQIDRRYSDGRFWTWADSVEIPGISTDLPGAKDQGKLRNFYSGMAIAIPDPEGRILGAQIRGETGGYFWVSSAKIGGNSPELPNGENPIGYYLPDSEVVAPEITIGEGFLKSDLTAQLHGRVVIGASGGNFAASSKQFECYLAAAAKLTRSRLVVLNADAGSQKNKTIVEIYRETVRLAESFGYEVRLRWYGQFAKSNGDSDEIDSATFNGAALLTWDEFLAIVPDEIKGDQTGFAPKVIEGSKEVIVNSDRDRHIARRQLQFQQILPLLGKDYKITHKPEEGRAIEYYEGYTPIFNPVEHKTTILRGFLAAGKTEAIIKSLLPHKDRPIIWVTGRNGLLRNTTNRLESQGFDCYHYQDDVSLCRELLRTKQAVVTTIAYESLQAKHVGGIDFHDFIVIVDEGAGVRREIIGKEAMLQFERVLSEADAVVWADAFAGDTDVKLVSRYRGNDRLILDQVGTKSPKTIHWVETRTEAGEIALSHDGLAFEILRERLLPQLQEQKLQLNLKPIPVVTDSKLAAKAVKLWAIDQGVPEDKILLICSDTPEGNHAFLPSPDERIKTTGAWLIIVTSTAESGVDIQAPTLPGLALFCGVLQGTQAMQLLGRFRQCLEWFVSAPRRSIDTPRLTEGKLRTILKRLPNALEAAGVPSGKKSDSLAVWQREIGAIARSFNSEFIYHLLTEHYAIVDTIEIGNVDQGAWRKCAGRVKLTEAHLVLTADLEAGRKILQADRQPQFDSQVWSRKLAEEYQKYPKIYDLVIPDYRSCLEQITQLEAETTEARANGRGEADLAHDLADAKATLEAIEERIDIDRRIAEQDSTQTDSVLLEAHTTVSDEIVAIEAEINRLQELDNRLISAVDRREEILTLTRTFLATRQIDSLRRYVSASEPNSDDDADLRDRQERRFTNYASGHFKQLQYQELFRTLDLDKLAKLTYRATEKGGEKIESIVPDSTGFTVESPTIQKLWRKFKKHAYVQRLFPTIETIQDFWQTIKQVFSYFGYRKVGENARIKTTKAFPNGVDRKGRQRFAKSQSKYFVGWLRRADSGSKFFREHFNRIIDAVRDRLAIERAESAKKKVKGFTQPQPRGTPPPLETAA